MKYVGESDAMVVAKRDVINCAHFAFQWSEIIQNKYLDN